ncbi:MAG: TetR/AcrR family transcriptional regulator [Microthrixaceae bacterium]
MPTPHRRTADESRAILVNACIDLLLEHPIDEVTNRRLEAATGINRSYVTRLFGSRDELLLAAAKELERRLDSLLGDDPATVDLLAFTARPEARIQTRLALQLLSRGVAGSDLLDGPGSLTEGIAQRIEVILGASPRASRALALHMQMTAGFIALFREHMDLDDDALQDVLTVARMQLLHSGPIIEQLGW